MQGLLITARFLHFAATISLAGTLAFACLIAAPAWHRSGTEVTALRRRLLLLAWASLPLALVSGAGWLIAVAADISGKPLGRALSQGVVGVVLTQTRFGTDWLVRLCLAVALSLCLVAQRWRRVAGAAGWVGFGLAALLLASLAWAGHGAATAGAAGDLHLAADILHLCAAGIWLGTLAPLALLLAEARRAGEERGAAAARIAVRRFSVLAIAAVLVLLGSGLVNTWFLAGSVPALVGTEYGRLLLGKVALFLLMLVIAAVNLLRLGPRLADPGGTRGTAWRTLAQLRRNALLEAAIGLGVLAIVGLLGILPPGLHTEPGWPFPFRINFAVLAVERKIAVAILAALVFVCTVAAVAMAAAGRYRVTAGCAGALVLCLAIGWVPLRPAIERAYPTSFYAPAQPYDAPSIIRGARVYADNCAACHGATGEGNGPATAGLPIRPANLTEAHPFAHSPGDLFWWVSHGKGDVMPGFAKGLKPSQRWDVIDFIRARAAGDLVRQVGPQITTAAAYPVPDFAFEKDGKQNTLRRVLKQGPVLLVLFSPPLPADRLQQLAAAEPRLAASALRVLAIDLSPAEGGQNKRVKPPFVVGVSDAVRTTLALFRSPDDGESELLLDRNGDIRARWTAAKAGKFPNAQTLAADALRAARFAVSAPSHAGHH